MAERTPGGWHHHVEKAQFEELVCRDGSGRVHFRGQAPTAGRRYRERVWPVFWRVRPRRRTIAGPAKAAALGRFLGRRL
jgi:hypothetical protein